MTNFLSFFFAIFYISLIFCGSSAKANSAEVVYAVNCGGDEYFSKSENISYRADEGYSGGVTSDAGKEFSPFPRASDDMVYRSERYAQGNLRYKIPIQENGNFVIVFKFSEVYFQSPGRKVFDVKAGGKTVISGLDIFSKFGRGVPHDEYVEISREGTSLYVDGLLVSSSEDGDGWDSETSELTIEFVKLPSKDNPKINAIVVYKGNLEDVPRLPPFEAAEPTPISEVEKEPEPQPKKSEQNVETVEILDGEDDMDLLEEAAESSSSNRLLLFATSAVGCLLLFFIVKSFFKPKSYAVQNGQKNTSYSKSNKSK